MNTDLKPLTDQQLTELDMHITLLAKTTYGLNAMMDGIDPEQFDAINSLIQSDYPFGESFDEVARIAQIWKKRIQESIQTERQRRRTAEHSLELFTVLQSILKNGLTEATKYDAMVTLNKIN